MKNLTKVIGLAPSEMDRTALIKLIRKEHQRISDGVEAYSSQAKTRKTAGASKRAPSGTAVLKKLKEKGVSLAEYEELLETQRRIKELEAQIGTEPTQD